MNFLPYPRGNRDEWISKADFARLSGAFLNNESVINRDLDSVCKSIKGLREYYFNKFDQTGGSSHSMGNTISKGEGSKSA